VSVVFCLLVIYKNEMSVDEKTERRENFFSKLISGTRTLLTSGLMKCVTGASKSKPAHLSRSNTLSCVKCFISKAGDFNYILLMLQSFLKL
jgi:hypothetical protein